MPLFYLDIEKRLGSEFWSNRYILQNDTIVNARGMAEDIVDLERTIHSETVTVTRFRLSTAVSGDGVYDIVPVNLPGLRAVSTTGGLLPLFNTLRIDITASTGRPSRKFYRGVLGESDINGDAITVTFAAYIAQLVPILGGGVEAGITDPQNTPLVNAVVHPFVQMRQLRRSRRKRTNGGGIFQ